jgi:hypothetical protein
MTVATARWPIYFILGGILIAQAATRRFNSPSWSRTYTTWAKYHATQYIYVLSHLLLYYLVSATIFTLRPAPDEDPWYILMPPTLLALVVVIGLLPMIPGLRQWRDVLRRWADIPNEAEHLSRALMNAKFTAPESVEAEVKSILIRRGFDPDDRWFPAAEPIVVLWTKAATVFHELRGWETDPIYKGCLEQARNEFDIVRRRYDQLSIQLANVLERIQDFGLLLRELPRTGAEIGSEGREAVRRAITDILSGLREDIAFFFGVTCLLVARGILTAHRTERSRVRSLQRLGFEVSERPVWRTGVALYAFCVVLISMSIASAVVGTGASPDSNGLKRVSLRIVMVGFIQLSALAVAIVPKMRWGFANYGVSGRAPLRFVAGAGAAAVVVALIVGFVFRFLIFGSTSEAWRDLKVTWPWVTMAFAIAATTAYLVQDNRWSRVHSPRERKLRDAIVTGVALVAASYVVRIVNALFVDSPFPAFSVGGRVLMVLIIFTMGALIGYAVPSAFREERPRVGESAGRIDGQASGRSGETAARQTEIGRGRKPVLLGQPGDLDRLVAVALPGAGSDLGERRRE